MLNIERERIAGIKCQLVKWPSRDFWDCQVSRCCWISSAARRCLLTIYKRAAALLCRFVRASAFISAGAAQQVCIELDETHRVRKCPALCSSRRTQGGAMLYFGSRCVVGSTTRREETPAAAQLWVRCVYVNTARGGGRSCPGPARPAGVLASLRTPRPTRGRGQLQPVSRWKWLHPS